MKKILLLSFLLSLSVFVNAQWNTGWTRPTTSTTLQTPNNPTFYINKSDTSFWVRLGSMGDIHLLDSAFVYKIFQSYRNGRDSLITDWPVITNKIVGDTAQINNILVWGGDTILKDSLVYVDLKTDSLRLRYIDGTYSKWYLSKDSTFAYIDANRANVINAYMNTFNVTSDSIWVTWPVNFAHDKYENKISAWVTDTIEGKISRTRNAIYNYRQTVSGFGCRVCKNAGTFHYFACDTVNLFPLLADFTNYWSKEEITTADTTRWAAGGAMLDDVIAVENEIPSGLINSSNVTYTLDTIPILNSERVFLNGIRQILTIDYTISTNTITFEVAPISNDTIFVSYDKVSYQDNKRYNIIPTGLINSSNVTYTLPENAIKESINVYLNGVRQMYIYDYPSNYKYVNGVRQFNVIDFSTSGAKIIFDTPPETGDYLTIDYKI